MDAARAEPTETRSGGRALALPLLVAGSAAAAMTVLHFRDPHDSGSYGYCPFYELTGWWCPGCGGLRGMHNLTEGRLLDAVHGNVLLLPLLVGFVLWWADWAVRRWRGHDVRPFPFAIRRAGVWIVLGGILAFTVVRNTPWGTWLTPV